MNPLKAIPLAIGGFMALVLTIGLFASSGGGEASPAETGVGSTTPAKTTPLPSEQQLHPGREQDSLDAPLPSPQLQRDAQDAAALYLLSLNGYPALAKLPYRGQGIRISASAADPSQPQLKVSFAKGERTAAGSALARFLRRANDRPGHYLIVWQAR